MKKSLLAVAAMGAFASAAQAQSSVTVYGILDVGYIGSNQTVGATKTQRSQFGQSAETTSRLGFRGTEDLGGGMSAFFTVELGLTPQNANLSGSSTAYDQWQRSNQNGGSAMDNRQSFVGLSSKGIGQISIGRQYTPVFVAGATTSTGQYNNVVGDVVYAGGASGTYSAAQSNTGQNTGIAYTNRASNALAIQSDRFGGLVVSAMAAMSNQDSTQTATAGTGNLNWGMMGAGANFVFKKLTVTGAYQSFTTKYSTGRAAVAAPTVANLNLGGSGPTTVLAGAAVAAQAAADIKDNQTIAGAVYDFGILKAYGQWAGRKVTSAGSEQVNRTAQQIGVRGNWTPKIESWASIGSGRIKSNVGEITANFTGYQLGTNYILSKRTNLYGIFGSTQTSSTANIAGGASVNQYAVGVRHTF
jgi:predicted porin